MYCGACCDRDSAMQWRLRTPQILTNKTSRKLLREGKLVRPFPSYICEENPTSTRACRIYYFLFNDSMLLVDATIPLHALMERDEEQCAQACTLLTFTRLLLFDVPSGFGVDCAMQLLFERRGEQRGRESWTLCSPNEDVKHTLLTTIRDLIKNACRCLIPNPSVRILRKQRCADHTWGRM